MKGLASTRKAAGMTQSELALKVGVTQASVAMWESGRKNPATDKLPVIADALGCTIDALFTAAS